MMKTKLAWIIATAVFGLYPASVLPADSIKVAFIAPLSGTFALTFEELLKQFRAAADEVNANGGVLGGKKIEIVPFDNKGTPQETLIALNRATDEGIQYVTSTISSIAITISEALAKYNARHPDRPVLFLNFDARDPSLTEERCNFWHFRFEPHADMQMGVLTDHIAAQPTIKKMYFIHQDYAWGQSIRRVTLELLKKKRPDIQIVGDDLIALGKVKDFTPYVAKIKASGADTVFTSNWSNDLILLIKAAEQSGLNAQFYTTHAWVVGTPSVIGSAAASRIKTIMTWHINDAPADWEMKLLRSEQKYQAKTHMDFLPSWQTIDMFAQALDKAGRDDPVKVAFALEGMHYKGPSGDSWMRPEDHQLMSPTYITSFVKAGQSGVKYDVEGTGFGWKTELLSKASDSVPPVKCQMERPSLQ
jgi:branched-chain amino acid transport system substrate-binding protein